MGSLFSKKKKPQVTQHDKAVLDLKAQRDRLTQYQKRITAVVEKETNMARQLVKQGKKKQAMTLLKKKKVQEQLLARSEQQLQNVQEMIDSVEFAQMQQRVFTSLKTGNETLTALNKEMNVDKIDALMEETAEAIQTQREIEDALAGQLSPEDNTALEGELDALEQTMLKDQANAMPTTPKTQPVATTTAEPKEPTIAVEQTTESVEPEKEKKPKREAVAV